MEKENQKEKQAISHSKDDDSFFGIDRASVQISDDDNAYKDISKRFKKAKKQIDMVVQMLTEMALIYDIYKEEERAATCILMAQTVQELREMLVEYFVNYS